GFGAGPMLAVPEMHLIGGWQEILEGLAAYGEAGATDLRVQVAAHDEKSRDASYGALADYLSAAQKSD
ncbi:MAG: hypothetical protein CFH10_02451, partial [Alphaproteobacteria bacterium MarineAlpha4_Bin2]